MLRSILATTLLASAAVSGVEGVVHSELRAPKMSSLVPDDAPRFQEVGTSCTVYISGSPGSTRSGTCKATALCRSDGKESVPGHCPGGVDNQCCVTPIDCEGKPASDGTREPGWCTEVKDCSTGTSQASSQGADGCNTLKASVKCCLGAGGDGSDDEDNDRRGDDDEDGEDDRSDHLWGYEKWVWDQIKKAWDEIRSSDGYPVAAKTPTCPADRQLKQACKENYGNKAGCDTLREPHSTCPANCKVNIKKMKFGSSTIPWVCQHAKTGPTRGYTQSAKDDPTRATPPPITRHTILERAAVWINERVRYSQRRMHGNPAYRTDCTGFVSMAFDLPQWGTTSFVRGALSYKDEKTIERVACKSMLPGDAMVSNGHIALFRRWVDKSSGKMEWWEERGTAYGAVAGEFSITNYDDLSSTATDMAVTSRGTFYCLRRQNIV